MDVADLLHLQAALQTDGVINPAADEKDVPGRRLLCRKPLDPLFVLQDFLDLIRESRQLFQQPAALFPVYRPSDPCK